MSCSALSRSVVSGVLMVAALALTGCVESGYRDDNDYADPYGYPYTYPYGYGGYGHYGYPYYGYHGYGGYRHYGYH